MSARLERHVRDLAARAERLEVPRDVEDLYGGYRGDPVGFCSKILGGKSATRRSTGALYQFDVLADLVAHPRVAVRSGHGVGKTTIDAWAALWWLCTRPLSRVVVLAPEYSRQIRAIVFSEIRKWARRSNQRLPVKVLASRVIIDGHGEEWSATGMSTAGDVDRLEGFHAEGGVLVICDEMKGIPQAAFDSIQGALTDADDAARMLVTSVPGGAGAGPFWGACRDSAHWKIHHIPSTDSSRVSPQWVADRARGWGEGSPLYQTRVLGEFADAGEGVLFPLPLLEAAVDRELPESVPATVGVGVDVARSIAGDWNATAVVRGGRIEAPRLFREVDTMRTVQRALEVLATTGAERIAVDVGGVGAGVVDRLRELRGSAAVDAVAFGGGATDSTRFLNRRAEMFWGLREGLERGVLSLPEDDELRADLSALRYTFTAKGQIQVESKDDVRTRLGRSPDRADAVALACNAVTERRRVRPMPWFPGMDRARPVAHLAGTRQMPVELPAGGSAERG